MMKLVLTCVAILICAHAYQIPYSNWPTSPNDIPKEETGEQRITQPILQTVLIKHPEYASNSELQRLFAQALAAHVAGEQGVRDETSIESDNRGATIVLDDNNSSEDLYNRKNNRRGGDQSNIENERGTEDRRRSDSRRGSGDSRRSEVRETSDKRRSEVRESSVKYQDSREVYDSSSEIRSSNKNRDSRKDPKSTKTADVNENRRKYKARSSNDDPSSVEERDSSERERSRVEKVVTPKARQNAELGNVAPVCILYGNYGTYAGQ